MKNVTCGHFRFKVVGKWILCSDCECGIDANSPKGRRILDRASGKKRLHPLTALAYQGLVESYNELVTKAGTTDPEKLADYANGRSEE